MIRFALRCGRDHAFDSWFKSSAEFEQLGERGLLACPVCGSAEVEKALMAPAVAARRGEAPAQPAQPGGQEVALVDPKQAKLREMLSELRAHMTASSEDVGDRFPEVARKMHFEEIEQKTVHGRATAEEAKALAEDGVPFQPLPGFPDDMN